MSTDGMPKQPGGAVPLVSVFIASYNGGAYAESAVRSVLGQTLTDLELVVLDDGSGTETLAILRRLAADDARVRLIESVHNGQIGALNKALSLCRGTYVARLDHDDECVPDRLEKQIGFLEANPDVAAVGGELALIDSAGSSIREKRRDPLKRLRYAPLAFPPKQVFLSGSTVTARRATWARTGGFRPEFKAAEDRDICWAFAREGRVVRLADVLVRYRVHDANLSLVQRRTQLYSQFLCSLSAVAAALGIDDAAARSAIEIGGDYGPAISAYERLLAGRYPVRTYLLYFLARTRSWAIAGYADGAALASDIRHHWRQRPLDAARLRTLATALRYCRRPPALTGEVDNARRTA